ncbi:MAG: GDP-mannose-dependent alpha-mannosyltransferase [Verrucomicrobia subdivision 3 bacterium]|nr:GDP-mannose-dependent alpha-mannosyltransferase [Limisphaerales bacterium]MCS1412339.1 GDP-mannose-dependent alpha-mannosyltransferase [Limisphaerales bacterium]
MRILLVTDAWLPQINGVVTTFRHLREELEKRGHEFHVIHPGHFPSVACPFYTSLRLAILVRRRLARCLEIADFDALHIATEGPIGWAARKWSLTHKVHFTSSYHTQFPQYLKRYCGFPQSLSYCLLRRFHAAARETLVPTLSVKNELQSRGFSHLNVWTRGVDHTVFCPGRKTEFLDVPGPKFLYCGRVAKEKGIEKFLELELPGTKVVVGDGPMLPVLKRRFPEVVWSGFQQGQQLASRYRSANVFVFPSETDTFGVVMLEALASGLPVAAFPVTGPRDVITSKDVGVLNWDLRAACLQCLNLKSSDAAAFGRQFTWGQVAELFLRTVSKSQAAK